MKAQTLALLVSLALGGAYASAEGEVKEAAEAVKEKATKVVRAAKDAACPLVDGKVKCAAKKAKHKVENAADEIKK